MLQKWHAKADPTRICIKNSVYPPPSKWRHNTRAVPEVRRPSLLNHIIWQNRIICNYGHVGKAFNVNCVQFHSFWCNCSNFITILLNNTTHIRRTSVMKTTLTLYTNYQRRIHASLKLQFWNYPCCLHNIHKCQVFTVNKQQDTLSAVFQDCKPYCSRSINL